MKHIKPYQVFESEPIRTVFNKEQLNWLDECAAGRWKLNRQTGIVDINGNFNCSEQGLTDFKGVRFGKVSGSFDCDDNELTSLLGAPQTVGGYFLCRDNQLTSLVGAPQTVNGDFWCGANQLTSLVGAPQTINGDFSCRDNQLTSLEGAPQSVGKSFDCSNNQLTSLEGAPQSVGKSFDCSNNQLTSLEGAPQSVGKSFDCGSNPVSESTLKAIFVLMKKGMTYQQALEEHWPKMKDVDRVLMYKEMPSLSPEDARKYKALSTYGNIKNYL